MDSPLEFRADTHQYFLEGVELPSVTRITRFLSVDVATQARPWLREAAARRGSAVHAACEALDYGLEPEATPETAPYLSAYRDFLRDYRVRGWLGVELPMGSLSLGYAGTADRVGIIDGQLAVVDLKSGSTLHTPSLIAQLTGYATLYHNLYGAFPTALYGLHLRRDRRYTLRPIPYDPALFEACRKLHDTLSPKKGAIS